MRGSSTALYQNLLFQKLKQVFGGAKEKVCLNFAEFLVKAFASASKSFSIAAFTSLMCKQAAKQDIDMCEEGFWDGSPP